MNEAAIISARDNRRFIRQADIDKAFVKVGIGAEKKSRVISEKDKKITAYHEAGHAILFHVLPDVGPVHTVSIIPTVLAQLVIPCRFRKRMKCLTQRVRCFRTLW